MKIKFNVLPFEFKSETVLVSLSKNKQKKTDISLSKGDAPLTLIDLFAGVGGLYTSFENESSREIANVEVNLNQSRHFALNYARHKIREYAHSKQGIIVSQNFIKDLDLWFRYQKRESLDYVEYLAATVKLQDKRVTNGFEAVITYEGDKRIARTPISKLPAAAKDTFSQVVFQGVRYKYSDEDAPFWDVMDQAFPVLTPELEDVLGIEHIEKKPFDNKYIKYTKWVEWIESWLRRQDGLTSVFRFPESGLQMANDNVILTVPNKAFNLTFAGDYVTKDIVDGFKKHGPYRSGVRNLRLIFLYQNTADSKEARKKYEQFLLNGLELPGRYGGTYQAISPLSRATKQLAYCNGEDDLVFSDLSTAKEEVESQFKSKLASYGDLKNCLVIYVSPISKDSVNDPNFNIAYGRLKELFINLGVCMQGIYADRVKDNGVQYSFTNIQAAICAKSYGTPWVITNACEDDLIFGVGAYRSQTKKRKYLGSAFAFDGTGIMKKFSCFQENTPMELRNNLKKAILSFIEGCNKPPRRIIIHFYKKMNQEEWQPIYQMLKNGLGKDIPVVVVTITLTDSNDMMAYDIDCQDKMPIAGTYLKVGKNSFLLFNNSKYNQADWEASKKRKIHHFPIKISMECRNSNILEDSAAVQDIIVQIFQLSRMYWKSVDQQAIPITVKYPSIIARFLPMFSQETIPNQAFGCTTQWFL